MPEKVSVLIVDHNFDILNRLKPLPEGISMSGQASSLAIAAAMASAHQPQVALVNIDMLGEDPGPALQTLRSSREDMTLAGVFEAMQQAPLMKLSKSNIDACLELDELTEETIGEMVHARGSRAYLSPRAARHLIATLSRHYGPAPGDCPAHYLLANLTQRERQLLECMLEGLSYQEMAARLHITASTVKSHFNAIYWKMGVSNRMEVLAYSYRQDLPLLL